jgi:hypothetical protein
VENLMENLNHSSSINLDHSSTVSTQINHMENLNHSPSINLNHSPSINLDHSYNKSYHTHTMMPGHGSGSWIRCMNVSHKKYSIQSLEHQWFYFQNQYSTTPCYPANLKHEYNRRWLDNNSNVDDLFSCIRWHIQLSFLSIQENMFR